MTAVVYMAVTSVVGVERCRLVVVARPTVNNIRDLDELGYIMSRLDDYDYMFHSSIK